MRIDWYTKGVLTVIAVLLAVIALRPYVGPEVVQAQGAFAGVQYGGNSSFFDTRTGELFHYSNNGDGSVTATKLRVIKLGQPLVREK